MNKAILIGNLTKDPEVRTTTTGKVVCTFSLAVNRKYTGQTGEKITDYFSIVAWERLGENCSKYLTKGSKVAVLGELQARSYEAKDGSRRYVTEIRANEVEFLSTKERIEFEDVPDEPLPF